MSCCISHTIDSTQTILDETDPQQHKTTIHHTLVNWLTWPKPFVQRVGQEPYGTTYNSACAYIK